MVGSATADAPDLRHPSDAVADAASNPAGKAAALEPVRKRLAADRRKAVARDLLRQRIRAEFEEMPGVRLTLPQATRLFGVSEHVCIRILSALVADGFLRCTLTGMWVRRDIEP